MKNSLIYFFSVLTSFVASFSLIPLWMRLYDLASENAKSWLPMAFFATSIAVFILGSMFLPDLLKVIFNREDRLWRKLKKVLPHWAEATLKPGSLSISWFEGYRDSADAVNNYYFDFKANRAKFSKTSDNNTNVWFEGLIKDGVAKLL